MRCTHCGVCCKETEMLLSREDIERLAKIGYERDFFAQSDQQGYFTLRNRRGYCVFYDVEKRICNVRSSRPLGCRIYPVIYDEEKGIVVDSICPTKDTVTEKQKVAKGQKVLELLSRIDSEAKKRRLR